MAVKRIDSNYVSGNTTVYVGKQEYQCLTTDTKPVLTENNNGSTCVVLNATTKLFESVYVWHDNEWYEL